MREIKLDDEVKKEDNFYLEMKVERQQFSFSSGPANKNAHKEKSKLEK